MSAGNNQPVVGVLLAGGLARRMGGGDKGMRLIAGRPMLMHVVERLKPQVSALVLNANGDPNRFQSFGLPVVADPVAGFAGPLAGVLAGMRWAQHMAGTRYIVSAATDTPFFPHDLVARFAAVSAGHAKRIVLAHSAGGLQPVFGFWPLVLADDLEAALLSGTRKVLDWTGRHDTVLAEFAAVRMGAREIDPFFNANTPEEIEVANSLMIGETP